MFPIRKLRRKIEDLKSLSEKLQAELDAIPEYREDEERKWAEAAKLSKPERQQWLEANGLWHMSAPRMARLGALKDESIGHTKAGLLELAIFDLKCATHWYELLRKKTLRRYFLWLTASEVGVFATLFAHGFFSWTIAALIGLAFAMLCAIYITCQRLLDLFVLIAAEQFAKEEGFGSDPIPVIQRQLWMEDVLELGHSLPWPVRRYPEDVVARRPTPWPVRRYPESVRNAQTDPS